MSLLCRDVEPTTIFNDKNMMVWPRVHTFSKSRHHCLVCVFVQSGNVTAQQEDLRSGSVGDNFTFSRSWRAKSLD